jgi:hypothetical protein
MDLQPGAIDQQVAGDVRVRQIGREIPFIVFLDVLKTEQQIKAFSIPPDRGTVRPILFAAVPLAFRICRSRMARFIDMEFRAPEQRATVANM